MPRTLASHRLLLAGGATAVALVALAVALLLVGAPLDYVSWPGLLRNGRIGRLNVPSSPLPALAQARSGLRAGQTAGASLSLSSLGSDLGLGQATTPAASVSPPGLGLAPAPLTVAPPSDPSVVGLTTPGVGPGPSGVGVLGPLPAGPGLQPPVGSPPVPAPPGPVPAPPGPVLTPVSAAPAPASSAPASPVPSPATPALPVPALPVSTPLPASKPASAPDPQESRTMDSGLRPGSSGARPGSSGGGDGRGSHRGDAGKGAKPPRDAPEVVHGHGRDAGPPPPPPPPPAAPPQDQEGPGGPAPAPTPEPRGPDLHPHGASGPSRPPGRSPDAPSNQTGPAGDSSGGRRR